MVVRGLKLIIRIDIELKNICDEGAMRFRNKMIASEISKQEHYIGDADTN